MTPMMRASVERITCCFCKLNIENILNKMQMSQEISITIYPKGNSNNFFITIIFMKNTKFGSKTSGLFIS